MICFLFKTTLIQLDSIRIGCGLSSFCFRLVNSIGFKLDLTRLHFAFKFVWNTVSPLSSDTDRKRSSQTRASKFWFVQHPFKEDSYFKDNKIK